MCRMEKVAEETKPPMGTDADVASFNDMEAREILEKKALSTLTPRYFTEKFDPVSHVLASLPDDLQLDSKGVQDLSSTLNGQLKEAEMAQMYITSKLSGQINENYGELIRGMRQIQEVDMDLARALIHVRNGRRDLKDSQTSIVRAMLKVLIYQRRRDRLTQLKTHVQKIAHVFQREKAMKKTLAKKNYHIAVYNCQRGAVALAEMGASRFSISYGLRSRMDGALSELRNRIDLAVGEMMATFDPVVYGNIIKAYGMLDELARAENDAQTEESTNADGELQRLIGNGVATIPSLLGAAQVHAINHAIREALYESVGASSVNPSSATYKAQDRSAEMEISPVRTSGSRQRCLDNVSQSLLAALASKGEAGQAAAEEIIAQMPPIQMVSVMISCHLRLCQILRHFHNLVEWHRTPFRNDFSVKMREVQNRLAAAGSGIVAPDGEDLQAARNSTTGDESKQNEKKSPSFNRGGHPLSSVTPELFQQVQNLGETLNGRKGQLWDMIQKAVATLLNHASVTGAEMRLPVFSSLLQSSLDFASVGEKFSESTSHALRGCLRQKSQQFAQKVHSDCIEELRMMLESESWTRLPVDFKGPRDILKLVESRSHVRLGHVAAFGKPAPVESFRMTKRMSSSSTSTSCITEWFELFERRCKVAATADGFGYGSPPMMGTVFAANHDKRKKREDIEKSLISSSVSSVSVSPSRIEEEGSVRHSNRVFDAVPTDGHVLEQSQASMELATRSSPAADGGGNRAGCQFIVTNAALGGFANNIGRYLDIMMLGEDIATDAMKGVYQLFDLYLYAVVTSLLSPKSISILFCEEEEKSGTVCPLSETMKRFRNELTGIKCTLETALVGGLVVNKDNQSSPVGKRGPQNEVFSALQHCPPVTMGTSIAQDEYTQAHLGSVCRLATGVESLLFTLEILRGIEGYVGRCVSTQAVAELQDKQARCASLVLSARRLIYKDLADKLLGVREIPHMVETCKWESTRAGGEPNSYVVMLVGRAGDMWGKLQNMELSGLHLGVSRPSTRSQGLPQGVKEEVWKQGVQSLMENLVEGISRVKKCSAEGRAQMLTDLQALKNGLEKIHRAEAQGFPRGFNYVEEYIKAYYLTDDLLAWIKENIADYHLRHFRALMLHANSSPVGSKARKEVLDQINILCQAAKRD